MRTLVALPPSSNGKQRIMTEHRRFNQQKLPLSERLAIFARSAREKASLLGPGAERDGLLRKAWQADTTADLASWGNAPGLRLPR